MKQVVKLTESELYKIVKQVIAEAIDESGYLQGAHKATLDNLNRKKDMGYLYTIRQRGKGGKPLAIPNSERLKPLQTHNSDMNTDFFKQFDGQTIIIPFSVYLNNSFIYSFNFTLSQIENIDSRYFSILGSMEITNTIGNPQSFMNAYSPRNKENVVLKYDFGLNVLKYPRNPKGLIIRPALNVSGGNNNWWNELILYVSDYIKGNHRFSRV